MDNQLTHSAADAASIFPASWDSLGLGVVIAIAICYLYIRLWRGRKSCHACPSSGAGCASCHVVPPQKSDKP
ncbi:hypothetical protein [uncultured Cohaesibacter sp.]|uniref:hypothetical protein n=1 Tax=uncultured Cohaesibacter sp. TaxID=1002546 RepID=UPI0029C85862|nr:hypothetical protein [uncultured Cohaesibacter sp.]